MRVSIYVNIDIKSLPKCQSHPDSACGLASSLLNSPILHIGDKESRDFRDSSGKDEIGTKFYLFRLGL